jgi:hypothetical protein
VEELPLPEGINYGIDVRPLNQAFANVTNSYKFFFLLAVLDWFDSAFEGFHKLRIPVDSLAKRMGAIAWYPAVYYGLSLGVQDKLDTALRTLRNRLTSAGGRFSLSPQDALRSGEARVLEEELVSVASRYVPFRLIRPFFPEIPSGIADTKANALILRLSHQAGDQVMYRIIGSASRATAIQLSAPWAAYLATYRPILTDWARWHLSRYLARRNPFATQIPAKILPPEEPNLTEARRVVNAWIENRLERGRPVRCLYTGAEITRKHYDLDHFLPRAFVAHDRIWNLSPVLPEPNRSKGMSLPSPSYLPGLVGNHADLLSFLSGAGRRLRHASRFIDEYVNDLSLDLSQGGAPVSELRERYESVVLPLMRTAGLYGLQTEWRYETAG